MNSRRKGKAGELELAAFLRERGFAARRGRQFQGGADSPDVVGIDGVHIECKRCETFNVYRAMKQAIADCGAGKVPVVMHRRNKQEWVAILRLTDFLGGWNAKSNCY